MITPTEKKMVVDSVSNAVGVLDTSAEELDARSIEEVASRLRDEHDLESLQRLGDLITTAIKEDTWWLNVSPE